MMAMITIPWPPSVNRYYRHIATGKGPRVLISREGRAYRGAVQSAALNAGAVKHFEGRLHVVIKAYPPDRRRRDLDNILKATLDALQHAGVYVDDEQIDIIEVRRMRAGAPGSAGTLTVIVTEMRRQKEDDA